MSVTTQTAVTSTLPNGTAISTTRADGGLVQVVQLDVATVPVSAAALPLPTGAATEAGHLATIDTSVANIPAKGQALAAASMPVVLTAAQQTALTPPAAITGYALEAGHLATIDTSTAKIPAQGQALAAASMPVVLPAAQITTLTPPTSVGVNNFPATQAVSIATNTPDVTDRAARLLGHVTVDSAPSTAVTNAGTFAVQAAATLAAETTKVIGTVNVAAGQTIAVTNANLDVALSTRLKPADTLAAVTTLGTITNALPAGTNALGSVTATRPANAAVASTAFTASDAAVGAPDGQGTLLSGTSTAGSVISVAVPDGYSAWTLLLKGMASGQTVYTEASINSTNGTDGDWVEIKGRRTGVAPGIEAVNYALTQSGVYRGTAGGMKYYRARLINSGATTFPTAAFQISSGPGAVFLNSGLPGGTSAIGTVTESSGVLQAMLLNAVTTQNDLLAAIVREQRITNTLLQSGLNVQDDLDAFRVDPYYLQS